MDPFPLIIDCDPGVDDAVALFMAFARRDRLDLRLVTTVGGNVPADHTARNACLIRQIARRSDVPVHPGARRPLYAAPAHASDFHGESGLGDLCPPESAGDLAAEPAAQAIIRTVMAEAPGAVRLAVTGPLTNLALALRLEPRLAERLGPVCVMGGARSEGGNITASAEFNIYADPHAAQIVLEAGLQPVFVGLDVTHKVRATADRMERLSDLDTPSGKATRDLLSFANTVERTRVGGVAAPLHDPCTIAWMLAPELFDVRPAHIRIETASDLTRGHTAVEFRLRPDMPENARWATGVDAQGVFNLLVESLSS